MAASSGAKSTSICDRRKARFCARSVASSGWNGERSLDTVAALPTAPKSRNRWSTSAATFTSSGASGVASIGTNGMARSFWRSMAALTRSSTSSKYRKSERGESPDRVAISSALGWRLPSL